MRKIAVLAMVVAAYGIFAGEARGQGGVQESTKVGVFQGSGDVGAVAHRGGVTFDAGTGAYTMTGSGENIWFKADAFQYAWAKMGGNVSLAADIAFPEAGKNPHRKAVLMVRQSLDPDSAYADVAVHGNGLVALQYRGEGGGTTHEVQTLAKPMRVRIVKRGDYFTMWIAGEDGKYQLAGATGKIVLKEPFFVGIGVCSHEKDLVEKAVFSKVDLREGAGATAEPGKLYSMMETIDVESTDRTAIYVDEGRFEAPNWMKDGKRLLFNRKGKIETIATTGGETQTIDTGFAEKCNNDHGISPDGKWLAVSDQSKQEKSQIYILPIAGGTPRLITENAPSYWHGWSPDGKTLAFVGERDGEFDIYTISTNGGAETRLTTAKGLDDGPEYTPDGKYIYFNSERTGHMQIWRMKADGSEQEQVTNGEGNDWFPHFSPDGSQMAFLTFDASVKGHPENKDVELRVMSMKDGKIRTVAKLFGGQGTINVPSWAPDGKSFAFVSYAVAGVE